MPNDFMERPHNQPAAMSTFYLINIIGVACIEATEPAASVKKKNTKKK